MDIKKLIEILQKCPQDMLVYMASDEEGNSFSGIDNVFAMEVQKSNGVGSFDALVIYPDGREVEQYSGDE